MCGRYSIFAPVPDLERRFDARAATAFDPRYNAAPGQDLPIVADDDPDVITTARWGLLPEWVDDPAEGNRLINARAETVAEKPSFREAYRSTRCLVLADGFYEWVDVDGRRQPYRVTLPDGAPFAMAGLWTEWRPTTTQTDLSAFGGGASPAGDAEPIRTFTILTTRPNDAVADLHDRMAVVLPEDREREWLETGDADLLRPYPDEMETYPVSTAVNDPSNDGPDLVRPLDGAGAGTDWSAR